MYLFSNLAICGIWPRCFAPFCHLFCPQLFTVARYINVHSGIEEMYMGWDHSTGIYILHGIIVLLPLYH